MTNEELENQLAAAIADERRAGKTIVRLLAIADERNLYAIRGYNTLLEWLTTTFKYAEGAAYRRISAAKLLRDVPAARDKLVTGEINLTTLSLANYAVQRQEKRSGVPLTPADKRKVIAVIENKSARAAERSLFELLPDARLERPRETTQMLDAEYDRLSFNLDRAALADLQWVKDYLSHAVPNASNAQVFTRLLKDFRNRHETSAAKKHRVKKLSCTYKDEKTGRVCGSTRQMEEDHIVPRALGGTDDPANLRPLCRKHNQLMAEKLLGHAWANAWRLSRPSRPAGALKPPDGPPGQAPGFKRLRRA